jgi:hypothetical protein
MRHAALRLVALAGVAVAMFAGPASHGEELRNWFNDPFYQVRGDLKDCPVPRGPFMDEAQKLRETHNRAERGTTCWLSGKCSKPNAYLYDPDIAAAAKARFEAAAGLEGSSLWITVQRRIVWIEGCVPEAVTDQKLEALARDVPDVEQVIVVVARAPGGKIPYQTLEPIR